MSRSNGAGPDSPRCRLSTNDKIDLCRGLFAFLVVIAHALEVTFSMDPGARDRMGRLTRQVLVGAAGTGIYWVMGFFVISGYCIHLSVRRLNERGRFPLKTYLIARATRILPLYYVALLVALLVEWWIAADRPLNWINGLNNRVLVYQVLLLQNLTQTYGSFASSWSITNEAFYYVLYGLLIVAWLRWGRSPIPVGIGVCLGVGCLLHLAYRLGLRTPVVASSAMLFGLGAIWFLGALVAAHGPRLAGDPRAQALARWWPLILAASIGLRCTYVVGIEFVLMGSGLAFTLMLIRFLGKDHETSGGGPPVRPSPRLRAILEGLGLASYPTYLFHGPVMMAVGSVIIRVGLAVDWRLTWVILASSGIVSGVLGGYLVEAPIMAWRASYLRRLGTSTGARPVAAPAQASMAAIH